MINLPSLTQLHLYCILLYKWTVVRVPINGRYIHERSIENYWFINSRYWFKQPSPPVDDGGVVVVGGVCVVVVVGGSVVVVGGDGVGK